MSVVGSGERRLSAVELAARQDLPRDVGAVISVTCWRSQGWVFLALLFLNLFCLFPWAAYAGPSSGPAVAAVPVALTPPRAPGAGFRLRAAGNGRPSPVSKCYAPGTARLGGRRS